MNGWVYLNTEPDTDPPRCSKHLCNNHAYSEWVTYAGYATGIKACGMHNGYDDDPFRPEYGTP